MVEKQVDTCNIVLSVLRVIITVVGELMCRKPNNYNLHEVYPVIPHTVDADGALRTGHFMLDGVVVVLLYPAATA